MIAILGTIGVMLMAAVIIYKKKKDKKLLAAEASVVSVSIENETVENVVIEEGGAKDDQDN